MKLTMAEVLMHWDAGTVCLRCRGGDRGGEEHQESVRRSCKPRRCRIQGRSGDACDGKQGNDKDVCVQQAKANRDKAKADAKASRKSQDAMADAQEDKLEADFKLAKEKCDALSGNAKDTCISTAKQKYHQ